MWPRNAAVACKRSRTCKRAKENITRPMQPMGLFPTTRIEATPTECCFPDCPGPGITTAVPLPNSTSHVTICPATPDDLARIGRKSMSRRSGQSGSIQKEGNWYVVRYWKDVAGQEKRQRVYERICPISGPGKPFSIRTGTQGQGDHRGQRSGHPGVFRQSGNTVEQWRDLPRTGRHMARRHAQP